MTSQKRCETHASLALEKSQRPDETHVAHALDKSQSPRETQKLVAYLNLGGTKK